MGSGVRRAGCAYQQPARVQAALKRQGVAAREALAARCLALRALRAAASRCFLRRRLRVGS